jgi:FMN phosphatase YigB (HAD superfamily)
VETKQLKKRGRAELVVFFDVDNTLLDNDRVTGDIRKCLAREVGKRRASRYWKIFETLRRSVGYADYLGALQRFRREYPHDWHLLQLTRFLLDYPFKQRVYEGAGKAIRHARRSGTVALLTDGDVVFQPRKIECSGLFEAVRGNVLIYVHKERELREVARRYPAKHYVLVDDKLRILTAVKRIWRSRVTTVFVRQGHYALDKKLAAKYPDADVTIAHIGDVANFDDRDWLAGKRPKQ